MRACKCQLFTDKGSCRLPKRLNYCVYHYNTSLKFTQQQIRYFRCLTSDLITCSSPNTRTSLTPGTHVPQGYSSCVCVCVVRFPNSNESATKNYGSPQRCSRLINNSFFGSTACLQRYRIRVAAVMVTIFLVLLTSANTLDKSRHFELVTFLNRRHYRDV